MGKVYQAPESVGPVPSFGAFGNDFKAYAQAEREWVAKVQTWAKEYGKGKYAGSIVRFPVADGYAQYVVTGLSPVTLIHLPIGDAWQFRYVTSLSGKDIAQAVEQDKRFVKLFEGRR